MGSYGDVWLQCGFCARAGKCTLEDIDGVTQLNDIDGVGLLCDPCQERGPPHAEYLGKILRHKLTGDSTVFHCIAGFAYSVYFENT